MDKFYLTTIVLFCSVATTLAQPTDYIAYYPFNGNANDESGNGNNGTINGAILTTDRFGNANSAYSFDGVDDYIKVAYDPSLYPTSMGFSFWMYHNSLNTSIDQYIISTSGANVTPPYDPMTINIPQGSSSLRINLQGNNDTGNIDMISQTQINISSWYHICVTFDEFTGDAATYINGALENSGKTIMTLDANTLGMIIGAGQWNDGSAFGNFVDGKIDDIRMYDRALSALEIAELYAAESGIPNITSFTPTSGPIGTSVSITGTNFDPTPANNIVFFGATQATVSAATTTELTVNVPTGATYQPITVLVNGLIGYSSAPFVVTFSGGGTIDANSFDTKIDFSAGTEPRSSAVGDLDGDGLPDLAVANQGANTLSILRNTSTGAGSVSYATMVSFATGTLPRSVAIGDLDGDGKADVVVSNQNSNNISIFRNTSTTGNISFSTKIDLTAGDSPQTVSIGDFDKDGKVDIAVVNVLNTSNTISIFRNTSTGPGSISYLAKMDIDTGSGPIHVSNADLDGDGLVDFAVVNQGGNSVSVFRNTSTGPGSISYATREDFAVGTTPNSLSIGDLDGDGLGDLVVTNNSSNTVSVLRNTSIGEGAVNYATKVDLITGSVPRALSIGDLDGDGKIEIAVANFLDNTVSIFRNTSTGPGSISYDTKVDFNTGVGPYSVSIGDMDGNGAADLSIANFSDDNVSVLKNAISVSSNATDILTFSLPSETGNTTINTMSHTVDVEVAYGTDVTSLTPSMTLSVGATISPNTSTSQDFTNPVTYIVTAGDGTTTQNWTVAVTVDDGLIVYYTFDGDAQDQSGDGNHGTENGGVSYTTDRFGNTDGAAIFDGVDDYIGLPFGSTDLVNAFTFSTWVYRTKSNSQVVTQGIISNDVSTDRGVHLQITGGTGEDQQESIAGFIHNTSDGQFNSRGNIVPESQWAYYTLTYDGALLNLYESGQLVTSSAASGDLRGSANFRIGHDPFDSHSGRYFGGYLDDIRIYNRALSSSEIAKLYAAESGIPTITSFTPTSGPIGTTVIITGTNFDPTPANNIVFFGATQATVSAATATELTVTVPTGATYQPITVLVNGLIGYSSAPFVVTFSSGGTINANSFDAKVDFETGLDPYAVSIGDLDGDGKADLAIANDGSNTVSVFRNISTVGTISYAPKVNFATGTTPLSVSIGDLDGDGKADLAVANDGSNTVSVFRNTSTIGTISYAPKVDFVTGLNPISVSIGDLNGDGKTDLAVVNLSSNTVSVFRNTCIRGSIDAGSFAAKVDFATGSDPYSVSTRDLDRDGKTDLVVTSSSNDMVSVFRNISTNESIDTGSFAAKVDFATGSNPISVSIGDLDGDGKTDLAVVNQTGPTISVFRNTSTGAGAISFAPKVDYMTGTTPLSVSIDDLDGDGKADLAVANWGSNTVSVFKNTSTEAGSISLATKVDYMTGARPYSVSIGDLDGDGKADLALANRSDNTVSVFRNIIESTSPSSDSDIATFSFPEQTGTATIDATNHTIGVEVNSQANLTALIATFVLSEGATAKIDATDQVSGTTSNDFTNPVIYTITAEDGTTTQDWTVTVTIAVSSSMETDITAFSVPGQTGAATIDVTNHTVDIEVAISTNITDLVATFTLSDGAIATINGNEQTSETTANNFSSPVLYIITAEDETTTQMWTVTVTVAPDTEEPIISNISAPETHGIGSGSSDLSVSATVTDNSNLTSVQLFSKKISATNFIGREMSSTGDIYSADIAPGDFDNLGVAFYIEATDAANNTTTSATSFIYSQFDNNSQMITGLSSGTSQDSYNIIAIPYKTISVNTLFSDILPQDKSKWRLWHYNGTLNQELSTNSNMEPGKGYWYINSSSSSINLSSVSAVRANRDSLHEITLRAGLNMIGNPYPFVMDWKEVISHNQVLKNLPTPIAVEDLVLMTYKSGYYSTNLLEKFQGAFVKSESAVTLKIPIPEDAFSGGRVRQADPPQKETNIVGLGDWSFRLDLSNELYQYKVSRIGMRQEAEEGPDKFDMDRLPRWDEFMDISFHETHTSSIVPIDESYVWKFKVNSTFKEQVNTMTWNQLRLSGSEYGMMLLDIEAQRLIDMRDTGRYDFKTNNGTKGFELYFGLKDQLAGLVTPADNYIGNPYPNPFKNRIVVPLALSYSGSDVRMVVYNIFGQKILELDKEGLLDGFYEFSIDLDGAPKSTLSDGTYILNIRIESDKGVEGFNRKLFYKK